MLDCFKEQNYKKMKANHNWFAFFIIPIFTVSKSKITKKWKPITTSDEIISIGFELFQRAKLQKNESQSQLDCNYFGSIITVSKSKITKKWKPITTWIIFSFPLLWLFQRAKLQKNESQSQLGSFLFFSQLDCFKEQNYKKMKANHN